MLFIRARTHSIHSSLPGVALSKGLLLPVCMRVQDSDKKTAMKIYAVLLIILLNPEFGRWEDLELDALRAENEQLRARNQELARQIILVKENMDEIESLARRNLGMIKEGEQFIFIVDEYKTGEPDSAVKQQSDQVKHD